MTRARLLAIGLDAAEQSLLRRWMDSGDLPNLAAFREEAVWGPIRNETGLYTGSVWPSIFTGVSAAGHGCYYYRQIRNGSYRTFHFRPSDVKRDPFWKAVSEAGRRVAVIDVPKSPLTPGLNGVQVVDWGLHDPDAPRVSCWPRDLAHRVTRRFGIDPVGQCDHADRAREDYEDLRDRLLERIERKRALIGSFLDEGPWDLFLTVFGDGHCAGHQLWHLHEQAAGSGVGASDDPLKDVYVALDRAVGRLVERAGADTAILIFTSHGFGPHYDMSHLLDEVLRRFEEQSAGSATNVMQRVRSAYRAILPVDWRTRLRPLAARAFNLTESIDDRVAARQRRQRCVFKLPSNDNCGCLRVNRVGREPHGRVRPGRDEEHLFEALREALLDLVDIDTGRPVVREVLRTGELFAGDHLDDLPDILVLYHRDHPIRGVRSNRVGEVAAENQAIRTGDHRPEGLFLLRAPDLPAGEHAPVAAIDLAPTMAERVGVTLDDVDGTPICVPT